MSSGNNWGPMDVWCPLIPYEDLQRIHCAEDELTKVNDAYDDWRATMRPKPFVGADSGILLDRIRMMMIGIGIACGQNRSLATEIQGILSIRLSHEASKLIKELPEDRMGGRKTLNVLQEFFGNLTFTRDIIPEEDMEKALQTVEKSNSDTSQGGFFNRILGFFGGVSNEPVRELSDDEILQIGLRETTNILKRLYMRLLSPSPWEY